MYCRVSPSSGPLAYRGQSNKSDLVESIGARSVSMCTLASVMCIPWMNSCCCCLREQVL